MKKKDFTDLKGKTIKDLLKMANDKKSEVKKAKMNVLAGKDKNLKSSRNLKRDIAQILTLVREKEIVVKLKMKNEEVKTEEPKAKKGEK